MFYWCFSLCFEVSTGRVLLNTKEFTFSWGRTLVIKHHIIPNTYWPTACKIRGLHNKPEGGGRKSKASSKNAWYLTMLDWENEPQLNNRPVLNQSCTFHTQGVDKDCSEGCSVALYWDTFKVLCTQHHGNYTLWTLVKRSKLGTQVANTCAWEITWFVSVHVSSSDSKRVGHNMAWSANNTDFPWSIQRLISSHLPESPCVTDRWMNESEKCTASIKKC